MNKNCYHLLGPTGVKYATEHIRQALEEDQPQYVIRADIKSFYKSIPHYKLIQDIKQHYHDPHLQAMLIEIIKNPIETARGEKNDDTGIALRGPLSQFFSALYLKPLDDAMSKMDVTYIRYQDDWVVLCKTKRQFQRCWKTMLDVLHERRLPLSRQKTRKGKVSEGFHFLGVSYLPTQPVNNTTAVPVDPDMDDQNPDKSGGGVIMPCQINRLFYAWFRMREPYVRLASRLRVWSSIGLLPLRSETTLLAGACGGTTQSLFGAENS